MVWTVNHVLSVCIHELPVLVNYCLIIRQALCLVDSPVQELIKQSF